MRIRYKSCQQCGQTPPVLYRVKAAVAEDWQFVCPTCLAVVKHDNPDYQYGGTWKSHKH
ncbi:MAG TPA: hypothetical protein VFM76_00590 [Methylophaga sp.]|nr:hypothetical protein [Methylophaga sp.]